MREQWLVCSGNGLDQFAGHQAADHDDDVDRDPEQPAQYQRRTRQA